MDKYYTLLQIIINMYKCIINLIMTLKCSNERDLIIFIFLVTVSTKTNFWNICTVYSRI